MKYIHVLIKRVECEDVFAQVIIFNNCSDLEDNKEIVYSISSTKEEIKNIILPQSTVDYAVIIDWVGGRPNDRR